MAKTVIAFWILCLLEWSTGRAAPGDPSEPSDAQPVRARLVADVEAAALGEEFSVGALFEVAPGWHLYWTYPGNTGKPTRVQFQSDEKHTKVLEPLFPAPEVFDAKVIEDLSFGYKDSLLVPANAMVYEEPPGKSTTIGSTLTWLACKTSCVTGKASPGLTLAVEASAKPSALAERFKQERARAPKAAVANQAYLESLSYENGRLRVRYALPGFASVDGFVPKWFTGGSCKIAGYGIENQGPDRVFATISLTGSNCLANAGGIVFGRPKGAAAGSAAQAFRISPFPPPVAREPTPAGSAETPEAPPASSREPFLLMLLFAFLGGLLLNVMPCVIPVVVPKILHVVRTAQKAETPAERRRELWTNSLAYTAGVLATMLALAVVVVILKLVGHEVGWGFQFQNPWFLAFMISLLLVAGLGMLKTFSLQRSCHVDDLKQLRQVRRKNPLLESFFTGLLVTFLGTPCTAPLLGPALGYAFTTSSLQITLFLLVVGFGLSAPFLLLGAWTGWTAILPAKVTERYDRVMRLMAFLLFATAVWLLSVLAEGYGVDAAMHLLWFLLVLALGVWIFGMVTCDADPWRKRLLRLIPILSVVAAFGVWILGFPQETGGEPGCLRSAVGIRWEAFAEQRVAELRAGGKTVFIDFTAEWCMNCKANERLFIETDKTKALLDKLGIATLKADATRRNETIQSWLKRFGRAGVPMYLIFPACAGDSAAVVLPEILTSRILHRALEEAGASKERCER